MDEERIVGLQIPETGASRDQGGDPDGGLQEDPTGLMARIQRQEEKPKDGGEHLSDGLMLADFFGGEDDAFLAGDEPDPGDEEFTGHDEGDKPDGQKAGPQEAHKGDDHEQFVGEGVEEAAEVGLDLPSAGEVAVQPVGEGGSHEKHEGQPGGPKRDGRMGAGLEENQ